MQKLKDAVEDDFFFEFFIDDLPIWGYIGEVQACLMFNLVLTKPIYNNAYFIRLSMKSFFLANQFRVQESIYTLIWHLLWGLMVTK